MNARVLTLAVVALLAAHPTFAADGDVTGLFSTFVLAESQATSLAQRFILFPTPRGILRLCKLPKGHLVPGGR